MHFANSARTARPTPNRIVGKPPTTSGPTAEEECPEISIQFSCKKLFIPTVAERRRRRHPPGRKLGESRRLAPKTPHGQARAAFSTAQPRPFFFPIFRKAERLYALAVSPTLRGENSAEHVKIAGLRGRRLRPARCHGAAESRQDVRRVQTASPNNTRQNMPECSRRAGRRGVAQRRRN